jgi:hypothetical protein
MHLLAGGNEDILPDVSAAARRLAKRTNRQQKRQNEATKRVCPQFSPEDKKTRR